MNFLELIFLLYKVVNQKPLSTGSNTEAEEMNHAPTSFPYFPSTDGKNATLDKIARNYVIESANSSCVSLDIFLSGERAKEGQAKKINSVT